MSGARFNMLRHLSIRNFAIVESLDLEFEAGFTALTGETGAGKSILIDALALALGERADAGQVRPGAERAEVAAEFSLEPGSALNQWLAEQALEGDAERVLLRRVVDNNGRSRGFINGHAATLAQLREAGEQLVDIHGQNAHQSLLRAEAQRRLLDEHAGLGGQTAAVGQAYREWQRLARVRAEHETHAAARNTEREQLAWQVEELAKLAPVEGEWEAIDAEHSRLAHAASLLQGSRSALDQLSEADGAASSTVAAALSTLRGLLDYDKSLQETVDLIESAEVQLGEAAQTLRRYGGKVELDPQRLGEVERRIEALHGAARRYRIAPQELRAFLDQQRARLAELDIASDFAALAQAESAACSRYRDLARSLSAARKKAAAKLSREVSAAMHDLAMKGGRFRVDLVPLATDGSSHGDESVEFAVSANPGMEPQALAKVASGGELSRISLAIMVIASAAAKIPTMIFDEVDAGIGGAVAEIVGRRLKSLGGGRQVLCVTHLPQVAALADHQWSVAKSGTNGKDAMAVSTVVALDDQGRIEEIARMLGGLEITATTRRHAAEMLGMAKP